MILITLFSFEGARKEVYKVNKFSGGYYGKVTPVPIPNTEVKLFSANNT